MPLDIDVLVVDASILIGAGHQLQSGDLQKILKLGRDKTLRIVVPHIAWEEWRTDCLVELQAEIAKARSLLKTLKRRQSYTVLKHFAPIDHRLPSDEELDNESRARTKELAAEKGIEILDLGEADATRAWKRYFALPVARPFNAEVTREERRKGIPDSWILEAAIGLRTPTNKVAALCTDGALAKALEKEGIEVYRTASALAAELDRMASAITVSAAPSANLFMSRLDVAIASSKEGQRRVLGFVAYLDDPSKDELAALLSRTDISAEASESALVWLASVGLIVDTGNHYIVPDEQVARGAAASVEAEMIKLLAS
jgi:hypothetical protein